MEPPVLDQFFNGYLDRFEASALLLDEHLEVKYNHKNNEVLCWIRDVCFSWGPQHLRCWDPIAKHVSNPDVAPF